jgi:hypothetical protein
MEHESEAPRIAQQKFWKEDARATGMNTKNDDFVKKLAATLRVKFSLDKGIAHRRRDGDGKRPLAVRSSKEKIR